MNRVLMLLLLVTLVAGCGGQSGEPAQPATQADAQPRSLIQVETPEPLEVPAPQEVSSDTDWAAKVHNKDIEIIQVLNVINPIAAYITAGFDQYGNRFSPTVHEEWADTQVQLGAALQLYDSCNERRAAGEADKQLFLDMEEVWQLLVKTGVAGVRTKSMIDGELSRISG